MVGIVEKEPFSVLGKRIADEVPEWMPPFNLAIRHLVQAAPEFFVKESMRS